MPFFSSFRDSSCESYAGESSEQAEGLEANHLDGERLSECIEEAKECMEQMKAEELEEVVGWKV